MARTCSCCPQAMAYYPILLMSGFVDFEAETSAFSLLEKPFEASRLAARVREIWTLELA